MTMRSENMGLEPRKRFASQQQKSVKLKNLVAKTKWGLLRSEISAKQLAERFSPFLNEDRPLLYEAAEALGVIRERPGGIQFLPDPRDFEIVASQPPEDADMVWKAIGAPPDVIRFLKEHPDLDVLAAVDAARHFNLSDPYATDVYDIPDDIMCGYALDWKDIEPFIGHIGRIPLEKAQELGGALFGSREPDVLVSPHVLENNNYLRGYYTFAYMLENGALSHRLPKVLGGVFFANTKPSMTEPYPFFLLSGWGDTHYLCVSPHFRFIAHGRVGDKYWVFFLMT